MHLQTCKILLRELYSKVELVHLLVLPVSLLRLAVPTLKLVELSIQSVAGERTLGPKQESPWGGDGGVGWALAASQLPHRRPFTSPLFLPPSLPSRSRCHSCFPSQQPARLHNGVGRVLPTAGGLLRADVRASSQPGGWFLSHGVPVFKPTGQLIDSLGARRLKSAA